MNGTADIIPMPGVTIVGQQPVSLYEANLVAEAAQRRLDVVSDTAPLLATLRARLNRLDTRIREQAHELSIARRRVREANLRAYSPQFSPRVYWGGVFLAFLGELAIAKAVLDFLEQPETESWMMAVTLGILVFASAKTTAKVVRQHMWRHGRWPEVALAAVANLALIFLFWEVAQLRTMLTGNEATGAANLAIQLVLYLSMVFWSMMQVDPELEAEQLAGRIRKLEAGLDGSIGLCKEREGLANQHNAALAKAETNIRTIEEDGAQRVYQYRDANALRRPAGSTPDWFAQPITSAAFEPLHLGRPVEQHPGTSHDIDTWDPQFRS